MQLTGKAKESFEDWYYDQADMCMDYDLDKFYELFTSMQFGVYVDFFDSVNIYLNDYLSSNIFRYLIQFHEFSSRVCMSDDFKTRKEARTQAIIKANELYNNK